jgi:hypothetical protein
MEIAVTAVTVKGNDMNLRRPLPVPVLEGPCAFFPLFLLNNLGMLTHLGIKTFF